LSDSTISIVFKKPYLKQAIKHIRKRKKQMHTDNEKTCCSGIWGTTLRYTKAHLSQSWGHCAALAITNFPLSHLPV